MGIENLEKRYSGQGHEEEKEKNIGEIKKIDGGIEVEVLAGCHKEVLKKTMQEIADDTGEVVIANFHDVSKGGYDGYIIIKPEN